MGWIDLHFVQNIHYHEIVIRNIDVNIISKDKNRTNHQVRPIFVILSIYSFTHIHPFKLRAYIHNYVIRDAFFSKSAHNILTDSFFIESIIFA